MHHAPPPQTLNTLRNVAGIGAGQYAQTVAGDQNQSACCTVDRAWRTGQPRRLAMDRRPPPNVFASRKKAARLHCAPRPKCAQRHCPLVAVSDPPTSTFWKAPWTRSYSRISNLNALTRQRDVFKAHHRLGFGVTHSQRTRSNCGDALPARLACSVRSDSLVRIAIERMLFRLCSLQNAR